MSPIRRRRHGARGCDRGFILVAVLWIVLALATLASISSAYVAQSAVALSADDDTLQSELLVTAAIELAAYRVSSPVETRRPSHGRFRFRLAGAEGEVELLSESARIDLNAAPKSMIAGLFAVLGAPPDEAAFYADRIAGWRTMPKANAPSGEDSLYRTAGLPYGPRGAPFVHLDELRLVLGVPPALVERAMPLVTIYSGLRDINVLDAAPEALAALPGMSPARLAAFLDERQSGIADRQFVARALGDKQAGATTATSAAYRVRARVAMPSGRTRSVEVVIQLMPGVGALYRTLSWQELAGRRNGVLRRLDDPR